MLSDSLTGLCEGPAVAERERQRDRERDAVEQMRRCWGSRQCRSLQRGHEELLNTEGRLKTTGKKRHQ
ncbi:hypothetical protein XELAEV_18045987mg [Xenopus laevis]|uniref:Uncharacterized protein n=1 Tax=Xenopus laevis TaxID=8355 RepID=A0A974BSB2_XENLA|nr:hypothetical protein XELAEV_18045987mg [Xenopus laevis]